MEIEKEEGPKKGGVGFGGGGGASIRQPRGLNTNAPVTFTAVSYSFFSSAARATTWGERKRETQREGKREWGAERGEREMGAEEGPDDAPLLVRPILLVFLAVWLVVGNHINR